MVKKFTENSTKINGRNCLQRKAFRIVSQLFIFVDKIFSDLLLLFFICLYKK
jgi:hypothetical protein